MAQLFSPYVDTELTGTVVLYPDQLNNELYLNIKNNLINNVEKKCFKDRGYICKVYKIVEMSDVVVIPEDPTCSSIVNIRFACKLCEPINGKEIICKVDRMNQEIMSCVNGPIKAIITYDSDKISNKFFLNENRNLMYKSKNSSTLVKQDDYVKIQILTSSFNAYDTKIITICKLLDMANDSEIEFFKKNTYDF